MNKIIGSSLVFLFLSVMVFAQSPNQPVKVEKEKTACCTPSEACAKKMGMTLEECKRICKKVCTKNTSAPSGEGNLQTLLVSLDNAETPLTEEVIDYEACAKKMGMTVEECKAKCSKLSKLDKETKVASAEVSSEISTENKEIKSKKTCSTSKKACCKKQ